MESYEVQVQQQAGKITCDFESGKTYLNERLEEYRNVVFTEDSKKEAKATVASLRKEKKAFTDRVKEVRDEYMKPLEEFAAKAKELADMYDQPINFINGQVSAFEQRRIEEKKEQIKDLYLECLGDMQAELPLNKIYNSKWENATTNPTQIRREMMERKETVKQGLDAIRQMHSDAEEKAVAMFLESYDLTKSILYINQYEQQKEILAREQERIRREEQERIRREEQERIRREEEERIRRELSVFAAYYEQLDDLFAVLSEETEEGDPHASRLFDHLTGRAQRLLSATEQEKEYALQLREMHQTQLDMRQNQIMKILTIVTTVFLPLSLIAGWYGMNFVNMPELTARHGYLAVCIVSAVCILVELVIFKWKKWL